MAYGSPIPMQGFNTPSAAPPHSYFHQPQTSLWQTSGSARYHESYSPWDAQQRALRQQQTYMQSQAIASYNIQQYGAPYHPSAQSHRGLLPASMHHHDFPVTRQHQQMHAYPLPFSGAHPYQPLHNSFEHQCSLLAPPAEPLISLADHALSLIHI